MAETVWIVITADDLNDYLVGAQMSALRTAALAAGQTDPFPRVMADVATRIRAEVRGCKANKVSNLVNSIPPDLKSDACALIIEKLQGRLAGFALTDEQKNAADNARNYLKRIANCDVPIA